MYRKIMSLSILFMALGMFLPCFSYEIDLGKTPNLAKYTAYIPQGQIAEAYLADELNSSSAVVGQVVKCYLIDNFKYGSTTIASSTSTLLGTVVQNKKSDKNEPAMTVVRFTSIRTPYNNIIPISATILTKDKTGILKGTDEYRDVVIQPDSKIDIYFDQPITIVAQ